MNIVPLHQDLIPQVIALMEQGAPYIRARTYSDYWLYARLFSSSCPVAVIEGEIAGAVTAFRSQDEPCDVLHPGRDDKSSVSAPGGSEGVDRFGSRAGQRVGLRAAVPHR